MKGILYKGTNVFSSMGIVVKGDMNCGSNFLEM